MTGALPVGAWRGFWSTSADDARHPMRLEVERTVGRFEAAGEDEGGRFTISGDVDPGLGGLQWAKSYVGKHGVLYRGASVVEGLGVRRRWLRRGTVGGAFAV